MECVNRQSNKEKCTCKNTSCKFHGICCECMRAHKSAGTYPHCFDDAGCITMKEKISSMSKKQYEKTAEKMKGGRE